MVLGSSPAPLSQRPLLNLSPNERDRTQDTPRDRIPISKVSSLQQHRQMGVLMRGCSISCTTAAHDEDAARLTQQRGQGTPVGSADKSFSNSALPWGTWRRRSIANTYRSKSSDEDLAIGPVPVADQIAGRLFPAISFSELICDPFWSRMRCYAKP